MKKNQLVRIISLVMLIALLFSVISSCAGNKAEAPRISDIKIESTQDNLTTYLVTFEDGSTTKVFSVPSGTSGDKITIGENGNFYINGVDTGISSKKDPGPEQPAPNVWKTTTVPLYNISSLPYDPNDSRYYDEEKDLSEFKVGDIQFIYAEGEKEILYTTLESYSSFFAKDLKK